MAELNDEDRALMAEMEADDAGPVTDEEQAAAEDEAVTELPPEEPEQPEAPEEPGEPEPEQPDANKPPEGYVPHQAMHQERERRRAAEARFAELEAKLAAMEAQSKPAEPQQEFGADMPDPIMNPEGFRKWQVDQRRAMDERWQQQEQQQLEQQRMQQRMAEAGRLEQEFAGKTPDYADAVQHLHQNRVAELRAYGYNDQQIAATIQQDANTIFDNATRAGRNPAEVMYEAARMRGWASKASAPAQGDAMAAKASAASQTSSLSTAGGPSQAGRVTLEQLANMSEAEMSRFKKKSPAEFAKIMGG